MSTSTNLSGNGTGLATSGPGSRSRELTVGIAGAAGDGLDKTGDTLAHSAARLGLHTYAYNSYQSLIRGGHTWLRLRIGERKVHCHGDHLNFLIALNQDSIERHAPEVEPGGVILFNGDKLSCDPALVQEGVKVLPIPFKVLTKDMGRLLPVMQNTISLGALMHLIGLKFDVMSDILSETFHHKGAEIIQQNIGVAKAGYDYAREHVEPYPIHWQFGPNRLPFMTGNACLAFGAAAGGCQFYAAYPMSPASSILDWMTAHAVKCGIVVKQVEDEIGVANMTIGAGHAGVRSMCATSGGGFALMTEAIGMSGMLESPAVFINVQRGGPSTGLPTKTEQADLNQAFGASQGDFPRVIVAPATATDCYYTAAEALSVAEEFQLPVMILSDLLLGEHTETLEVDALTPDVPIERGELLRRVPADNGPYKRYKLTASGISPRAIPGTEGAIYVSGTDEHDEEGYLVSDEHTNAAVRRVMAAKRMRKMDGVLAKLPAPELQGDPGADVTLIGWGSTWGAIHDALERLADLGVSANHLHIKYLVPFHTREVKEILGKSKKTIVLENNATGQFARHLRAEAGITVDHLILRFDGEPFAPAEVAAQVKSLLAGQPLDAAVTAAEAQEIAYHYIRIHLDDRARPAQLISLPADGYGEPLWKVSLAARDDGAPMGDLLIGRNTGATYELQSAH
ncbi:MAG TPA: 2-oxoacid:acceptor oxidoreductase subunit alpha [Armatimonadota bacterium]|nr:2-oxoacid:acceptor oxidoreductase subunit alpha [Armatimonadota bacterium]